MKKKQPKIAQGKPQSIDNPRVLSTGSIAYITLTSKPLPGYEFEVTTSPDKGAKDAN